MDFGTANDLNSNSVLRDRARKTATLLNWFSTVAMWM